MAHSLRLPRVSYRLGLVAGCLAMLLEGVAAWTLFRATGTVGWRLLVRDLASAASVLGLLVWVRAQRSAAPTGPPAA